MGCLLWEEYSGEYNEYYPLLCACGGWTCSLLLSSFQINVAFLMLLLELLLVYSYSTYTENRLGKG